MKGITVKALFVCLSTVVVLSGVLVPAASGQQAAAAVQPGNGSNGAAAGTPAVPTDYVIGARDVLSVIFWRDKELSADVTVRPDGKISLNLVNDVQAAGRTPEELRLAIVEAASKFIEGPTVTVMVKEIHSRDVFITGEIGKPGAYPAVGDLKVMQLIAQAGGLLEYADSKKIVITREENGRTQRFQFNYKDFVSGKNVAQNITLRPGDTVIVPE
jgi:polysaccharide export outer membrane protein